MKDLLTRQLETLRKMAREAHDAGKEIDMTSAVNATGAGYGAVVDALLTIVEDEPALESVLGSIYVEPIPLDPDYRN